MQNSLVSIIMNCHNGEKYLYEAINSILNQSYLKWELIFWDNQSSDNSASILKSFKDDRIKYFKSKNFTNLGKARKLAFAECKGEFIAFLDTDDIWFKEKLKVQLSYFKNGVGIVTCNTFFFNEKKKETLYKKNLPDGYVFENLLENYNLSLETLIIKKNMQLKIIFFLMKI